MAETDTRIYQPLKPQENQLGSLGPLQIFDLAGKIQHNKLTDMDIKSREGIADSYRDYDSSSGDIRTLQGNLASKAGYRAAEALTAANQMQQQAIANKANQMQLVRSAVATLGVNPNLKPIDITKRKIELAAQGVDPNLIQEGFSNLPQIGDKKGWKEFGLKNANLTQAPADLYAGSQGPINPETGVRPEISSAQAQAERLGLGKSPEGMATELPIGEKKRKEVGGDSMAADFAKAGDYGSRIFPMEEALESLKHLGPTDTGPGKEDFNRVKSFIQSNLSWLPGAEKLHGDPETIKDFDKLTKYLTQIAGARAGSFGHGTDQALSTALTASPNTHISNLATKDLLKATVALTRMEQIQTLEAYNKGIPEYQYPIWKAKWATSVDPRAFMLDKLDPEQRVKLFKSLDTPEKKRKFKESYNKAISTGVIESNGNDQPIPNGIPKSGPNFQASNQ